MKNGPLSEIDGNASARPASPHRDTAATGENLGTQNNID